MLPEQFCIQSPEDCVDLLDCDDCEKEVLDLGMSVKDQASGFSRVFKIYQGFELALLLFGIPGIVTLLGILKSVAVVWLFISVPLLILFLIQVSLLFVTRFFGLLPESDLHRF